MSITGRVVTFLGSVAIVAGFLLEFASNGSTTWQARPQPVIIAIVVLLVVGVLLFVDAISAVPGLRVTGAILATFIGGEFCLLPFTVQVQGYGPGFWVQSGGGFVVLLGGLFLGLSVLTGSASSQVPFQAAPAQFQPGPAAATGSPPAGWYADPMRQATKRYWSGSNWTDQVG